MKKLLRFKGFFDLQVNGYKGVDFSSSSLDEDKFVFACRELYETGTIGFLPTLISSSLEVYERNLKLMTRVRAHKEFKKMVPGFHLEGPFLSPEDGYRGVHPRAFIRPPDQDLYRKFQQWSGHAVKLMTLAAELPGSDRLCRYASKNGTVISLGHQKANEKQVKDLCTAGARLVTHLGNGIPHLLNRHQNPLWPSLAEDSLSATLVADGFHLPFSLLKTIFRVKGLRQTIIVSDLSPVGGLKPGEYQLWGQTVKLESNGFLHHPQSGYLAASSFTLLDAANYLLGTGLVTLPQIYKLGFLNPLHLLGISPAAYSSSHKFRIERHTLTLGKS